MKFPGGCRRARSPDEALALKKRIDAIKDEAIRRRLKSGHFPAWL
jgi:hypothetical protein